MDPTNIKIIVQHIFNDVEHVRHEMQFIAPFALTRQASSSLYKMVETACPTD
jgi:hypothetical protein